jgi:hypothetical protein
MDMHINVNDSNLWPAGTPRLRLACDGDERFALRTEGRDVVHLDRCRAHAWSMTLEHGEEVVIPVGEAWELAVCDEEGAELGPVGERMLVRTGTGDAPGVAPDAGVLAWAAFGALWQLSGRTPIRG